MKLRAALIALCLVGVACGDASTVATTQSPGTDAPTSTAPTTTTPPATTAPPTTEGIVPGEDADVDAVVEAYTIAFDSTSTFDVKSKYIDDPSGLESTVAGYIETGESFGGIDVVVSSVVIDGTDAAVVYDLFFSGNPTYPDLKGIAVMTDAGWQVPRAQFCSVMSSARVPCS